MNKQRSKKRLTKRILFVLVILSTMLIVPASASDSPIFAIEGKTTSLITSSDEVTSKTLVDEFGFIDIPYGLFGETDLQTSYKSDNEKKRYDLVTFDNPIEKRTNSIELPIKLYNSEYLLTLEKMDFESIDDGIDSYKGSIPGIEDSLVLITVGNKNVIHGFIELPDDYISIYPVQNDDSELRTANPVHIVYSIHDVNYSVEPFKFCGDDFTINISAENDIDEITEITRAGPYDWAYVNVLVVTDRSYYHSNWMVGAQQYFATANVQFQRSDIKVVLNVVRYDHSRMDLLENHIDHSIVPWQSVHDVYLPSYLVSQNADICIYFGGSQTVDPMLLGQRMGRYAWVQMVPSLWGTFLATDYDKSSNVIHEIGHIFGASHSHVYSWFDVIIEKYTIMSEYYYGQGIIKYQNQEFSSTSYRGDAQHNNAQFIRTNKHYVSELRYSNRWY